MMAQKSELLLQWEMQMELIETTKVLFGKLRWKWGKRHMGLNY